MDYSGFNTPNEFLEEVIQIINHRYGHRTKGDCLASVIGIFRAYKSEIKALYWTNQSTDQVAEFLSQFLILNPNRSRTQC